MKKHVTVDKLIESGLTEAEAQKLASSINPLLKLHPAEACWKEVTQKYLKPDHPFPLHQYLHEATFSDWDPNQKGPVPAWVPGEETVRKTNLFNIMEESGFSNYSDFYEWSAKNRGDYWESVVRRLGIVFKSPYREVVDLSEGVKRPNWLVDAKLNIADSCFSADPDSVAIIYQREGGPLSKMTCGELDSLSNGVANGLVDAGFRSGDKIAIDMTMTTESVAIYLGIVKAGCVVVSIADSFAPAEIKTRLDISEAKGIFTQDVILRGGKKLPMYSKIVAAEAPKAIVLPWGEEPVSTKLRQGDLTWEAFLSDDDQFESVPCRPDDPMNILFSSGTTGEPKAIPWEHITPIKSAADGHLHHDIQPGDVVAWPTNMGWMMGPWLTYSSLINRGTMALYYGPPTVRAFGEFVQDAGVNMLGLFPSVVRAWRHSDCMRGLDWGCVKTFSSTGECSNGEDYFFLMSLAGYRPVIEYCGGTELGGGYIAGTLLQPASPAAFTTPALGVSFEILNDEGKPDREGELFIVPPSIGLSTKLLNRDHDEVFYEGVPKGPQGETLRRHGDDMEALPGGTYRALGRADDTMNLGGIKVGSTEIERVLDSLDRVSETAAIGVSPPGGGPSRLVIYAVLVPEEESNVVGLKEEMQKAIKEDLNPLFRVHDVVVVPALPRTASNKVMRRELRSSYKSRD
jgi:acetyl-CoA synthetase